MSISPEDFLDFACAIQPEESEIAQRAGVSRAYYAAYHACQLVAQHCPEVERGKEGEHQYLIRRFSKFPRKGMPGGALARQIGVLLGKAKAQRVEADYYLDIAVRNQQLKDQIAYVERIRNLAEQFRAQQMAAVHTDG